MQEDRKSKIQNMKPAAGVVECTESNDFDRPVYSSSIVAVETGAFSAPLQRQGTIQSFKRTSCTQKQYGSAISPP